MPYPPDQEPVPISVQIVIRTKPLPPELQDWELAAFVLRAGLKHMVEQRRQELESLGSATELRHLRRRLQTELDLASALLQPGYGSEALVPTHTPTPDHEHETDE